MENPKAHDEERISLAGLDPEEALRALLKVNPASEPIETDEDEREPQQPPATRRRHSNT
jgi:hypothetical protein